LFLSHGFTLNRFIHLKKLSLCRIRSTEALKELLIQCKSFSSLTHLKVIIYDTDQWEGYGTFTIDIIWGLPKLTHCNLENILLDRLFFSGILGDRVTSHSIEFLSILNIYYNSSALSHILQHTPSLQRLCVVTEGFKDIQLQTIVSRLISLNLSFQGSLQLLINLFQNMPNLNHLTIQIYGNSLKQKEF